MSEAADARAPLIVGLVGGEGRASDERVTKLALVLDDVLRALRKRLPNTPIEFITIGGGDDVTRASREFAKRGVRGWAAPGQSVETPVQQLSEGFCGLSAHGHDQDCAVRGVCRYAHVLIDIAPVHSGDDGLRQAALQAWADRTFKYGDDNADDEQLALLEEPFNGPVLSIVLQAGEGGKFKPGKAWRWVWNEAPDAKAGDQARALSQFDALNRALRHASPRVAKQRSDNFLSPGRLVEAGIRLGEDRAFDRAREMFGFASCQARAAKRMIDRFNYIYALTPPLAVIGYETLGLVAPDDPNAALWIYVLVIGGFLAIAFFLMLRGDHQRLLELRVTAELLRAQAYWRLAGIDARLETSVRRWLPGASPAIEAAARSIDFLMVREGPPARTSLEFVEKAWVPSQIGWHYDTANQHRRDAKRLEIMQVTAFIIALLLALALLAIGPEPFGLRHVVQSLAISSLPAVAGGLAILRERFSYQALSENYMRMNRLAISAQSKLTKTTNAGEKRRLIEQFGRETIRESIEWMLTHRLRRIDPLGR